MYLINGKGSIIRIIAGIFILASVILGMMVSKNFLYFTALVGSMLLISGTIGFCPMELMLKFTKIERRSAVKEKI